MKKLYCGILASSLLLSCSMPWGLPQLKATELTSDIALSNPSPMVQQTLGGPLYYCNYTQSPDYLTILRKLEEGTLTLPTEAGAFHSGYAETLRALAGNRTVYHQILGKLTTSSMSNTQKVKAIYNFPMYNFIRYDTPSDKLPSSYLRTSYDQGSVTILDRGSSLLAKGNGGCQEYATLFHRLMNTAGFPCFNVYGDYINSDGSTMWHAYSRAKVNGTWYWYDVDVEGTVFRRGSYSSPIYYLYQKDSSYWRGNHNWDQAVVSAKQQEFDTSNYYAPSTIINYQGETEVLFNGVTYRPSLPVYGFVDIDSDFFTETVLLLPFFEVMDFLGVDAYWDNSQGRLAMTVGENTIEFKVGSYTYWYNGQAQNMAVPIQVVDGQDYISADEILLLLGYDLNMQFYQNTAGSLVTIANFQGGSPFAQPKEVLETNSTPETEDHLDAEFLYSHVSEFIVD